MRVAPCAEFLLVTACCVWPPSEARNNRIRAAAASGLDWPRLLKIAERHRVAALVYQGLREARICVAPPTMHALSGHATKTGFNNLALGAEAVRLQTLLDAAGVGAMFLKGVTLAVLAYGSLPFKHGKDIDLLVPPSDALLALRLLEDAGYEIRFPARNLSDVQRRLVLKYEKEIALFHPHLRVQVELHWHLVSNPMLLSIDVPRAIQHVSLSPGISLPTLGDADLFAYLCVHGARHGWSRLKWLADLAAFISKRDAEDIDNLYRHADLHGAGRCAGQALLLCQDLFGMQLPQSLARQFDADTRIRKVKAVALNLLYGSKAHLEIEDQPFATTGLFLSHYLLGSGWRFWFAEARQSMMHLPDALRVSLPSHLSWLYGFYGFVRIPVWIWRKIRYGGRMVAH